ncbi:hypothetical protein [Haladaptatus sp. ZSTT2]|uniref:hypothetical protein n=1 Tax=Haladaptatus sp. ZSTT2 TaxID=3120515 RepID=UPI00300EF508
MRRTVVALCLALVVAGLFVPAAVAQSDEQATTTEISLQQLQAGGEKPANAPDSVRASGTYGEYAVQTLPTGIWVPEGEDSGLWSFMAPGETVKRNHLQLHSKRGYGLDAKNLTVRLAYYKVDERAVQTENGTVTRQVATNVSTQSVSATVPGGYSPPIRIDLKPHYDGPVNVVMCVQEESESNCLTNPTKTRWHFVHHSSKAAQGVQTTSAGGRLAWAFAFIVLPFSGFTASTLFVGRKVVRKARASPDISLLVWVLALIGIVIAMLLFWDQISNTLITAPWVLAILGGILLGILAVEWFGDETYLALFLRLRQSDATDPSVLGGATSDEDVVDVSPATDGGSTKVNLEQAPGRLVADAFVQRMVRGSDGTRSAIRSGFWKFIARFRGARADLEAQGNLHTRIDVEGGPYSELYLLDPETDSPAAYQPESHSIEFPELRYKDDDGTMRTNWRAILGGIAGLSASYLLGSLLLDSGVIGLLVGGGILFVWKVAAPVPGFFRVKLAPVHYGNALATIINHADKLGDVKSWDSLFEMHHREKAANKADNKALAGKASASQMDEIAERYVGNQEPEEDDDE